MCTLAAARIREGDVSLTVVALLASGATWLAITLGMVTAKRGRRWLVIQRAEWLPSGFALVFALLLADLSLTWLGVVPTIADRRAISPEYTYYRYSGYRMVPKDVQRVDEPPLHINARGFRGAEIEMPKPSGRTRVAFLGGSHVFDFHGGDWPASTGERLRARGYDIDVVNAGVPGHNSTDALTKLVTDLWTLELDFLFACHGWNDIKYFGRITPAVPYRQNPPATPQIIRPDWRLHPTGADRLLAASAFYRLLRDRRIGFMSVEEGEDMWRPTPPTGGAINALGLEQLELNLELIAHAAERLGVRVAFCKQVHLTSGSTGDGVDVANYIRRNTGLSVEELERAYASVNRTVDRVAERTGSRVLDMRAAFSERPDAFRDPIHFNAQGSDRAAALVSEFIASALLDM